MKEFWLILYNNIKFSVVCICIIFLIFIVLFSYVLLVYEIYMLCGSIVAVLMGIVLFVLSMSILEYLTK